MRERWKSRFGFIMATAGFAVGLGNIWRFPYIAGQNGGAIFVVTYLAMALLIAMPLLVAEMSLGRKSQRSPLSGMRHLTGRALHPWNLIAWCGTAAAVLIMSYYPMLIAWIIASFVRMVSGGYAGVTPETAKEIHEAFTSSALPVLAYLALTIAALAAIVSRGLQKGLERVAGVAMPLLLVLICIIAVRAVTLPGAAVGLRWYLQPDVSELSWGMLLDALSQAFYSIGVGMAAAFGFGSYLDAKRSDIPGDALLVTALDTVVAIVAGLMIFPAIFALGLQPNQGSSLLFVTMPSLFERMPAGQVFGCLFFFLMIVAGLTSAIALFEVLVSVVVDSLGMRRERATWALAAVLFVCGVPVVLASGAWNDVRLFEMNFFELADVVSGRYLLTVGGLLLALYTAYSWGFERFRDETNVGSGVVRVTQVWWFLIVVVIPVAVATVLAARLGLLG